MFFTNEEIIELCSADGGSKKVSSAESAYQFCESIAKRHYENFPVGSVVVPKRLRKHFYAVYAYSRLADDIADEFAKDDQNKEQAVAFLESLAKNAESSFENHSGNPIFMALSLTMKQLNIPAQPFQYLTIAFIRDINFTQPDTIEDLFDYCKYSANPVGEIVLRLYNQYNEKNSVLSDKICTALQLANFWQDLSCDISANRFYIPKNVLNNHNIELNDLIERKKSVKLQHALTDLYNLTYDLFKQGQKLIGSVDGFRLKLELNLIQNGGLKILSKVVRLGNDILTERPRLGKSDIFSVLIKSLFSKG